MKKIISFLILIFPISAFSLSLKDATDIALAHSHELKIQKLQLDATDAGRMRARSGFLPHVELTGRHLFNERFQELEVDFNGSTVVMPAIQPYSSLGVTAKWNLFNGFQDWNQWQASRAENVGAEKSYQHAVDEKKVQVRTLFSKALASQQLVNVLDQSITALESYLHDVRVRLRSGVSSKYDILRAEVRLEEVQTEKVKAGHEVRLSRARLFEALGVPDDGKPLAGKLQSEFAEIDFKKIPATTGARTDRAILAAQKEKADALYDASLAHWLPSVALFGNYEWYNNINHSISENDNRFKSAYGVGVLLTWDLFDGGADFAKQKQALVMKKMADENLAQYERNLPEQIETMKDRFEYDLVNFKAKQNSLHKAEEAARLARMELKAGTRTGSEILDSVVDLNRARAAAIQAQVETIEDLGRLELALETKLMASFP